MDEYGPQTEEIKRFLERVRNITPEQAEKLYAVRRPDRSAVYDTIWQAVWNTVWNTTRYDVWNTARHAVLDVARYAVLDVDEDAFWDVILDAVLALVVKDKISEEHFNTLYGPWKSVMEK